MLSQLLTLRSVCERAVSATRDSFQTAPDLHRTLQSLHAQLTAAIARLVVALRFTSPSNVYVGLAQGFVKLARLCIEALDWLLLPRLAWKLTVRHCVALLVLYALRVFCRCAIVPVFRRGYELCRPYFINGEYLNQEKLLQVRLDTAHDYPTWKKSASELDRLQGRYHWKESAPSLHYDWRRIRDDLGKFRELVDARDVRGIMAFSRSRLLRNLVGINDRRLYTHLRAGTKRLIEEYISEVVRALQLVCVVDSPGVGALQSVAQGSEQDAGDSGGGVEGGSDSGSNPSASASPSSYPSTLPTTAEKLSFFNETRHAFGRSALLLSGGATLGLYHIGVMKALFDNNLLPRVLSGSSVGSIICAMVGTRTDEGLRDLFSPDGKQIKLNFFPPNGGSVKRKITRLFTQGVLMDIKILKANVAPLTFQEAYELSGRIINIVVSPASGSGNKDSLRLLNYLTAPNVLVWSAALASCAIPGVYAPVELMKKDEKTGKLTPYMEGGAPIKWEDGSVQADLPMQRLSELFNINHFIVSQVNPHVVPFISSASSTHTLQQSFLAAPLSKLLDYLCAQLKSVTLNFLNLNIIPIHPSVKYVLDQKYLGDITLVPRVRPMDYTQLLVNPTPERLRQCILQSEASTWTLIPTIRGACEIEFTLDECVRRMRGTLILEELSAEEAGRRNNQMSRVRSWSSDLLAVGAMQANSNKGGNTEATTATVVTTDLPRPGLLGARAHSEQDVVTLPIPNNIPIPLPLLAPIHHPRTPGNHRHVHLKPASSVKRSKTALVLAPSGGRGGPDGSGDELPVHEAEEDDEISEEEEEAVIRKRQQERWERGVQSDPDADMADEDADCRRANLIDDEGVLRERVPLVTPPALSESPIINVVSPGGTPGVLARPEGEILMYPSAVTGKIVQTLRRTPVPVTQPPATKHINIFSPDSVAEVGATVVPDWRQGGPSTVEGGVSTATKSASPPTPSQDQGAVLAPIEAADANVMSRLHNQPQQPVRRRWESDRSMPPARTAPRSPPLRSDKAHTPDPDPPGHLAIEWYDGGSSSPVLTELLRTSQAKPPRRMSTMDLARLEDDNESAGGAGASPGASLFARGSSHHSSTFNAAALHSVQGSDPENSGDEEAGAQRRAEQAGEGPLSSWIHRAASFLTGEEAVLDVSAPRARSPSDLSDNSAPHTPLSGDEPPSPSSPRSRAGSSSSSLSRRPVAVSQSLSHMPPASSGASIPSAVGPRGQSNSLPAHPPSHSHSALKHSSAASSFLHPTQAAADRERLRQTARFAAVAGAASAAPVVMRAASNGLPRTLSQLELVSDVATMP